MNLAVQIHNHYIIVKAIIYMLGAKYGFAQSTDYAAQTMDPYFAGQSMDFLHGSRVSKGAKYKFEDNPRIALHKQLIAWFARRSSPRINYRSQV